MEKSATLQLINQLTEVEQKIRQNGQEEQFQRNFSRMYHILESEGYVCQYPLGEAYSDSRTDCEANIAGSPGRNMVITKVIKPIVYQKGDSGMTLLQRAVVIVENK